MTIYSHQVIHHQADFSALNHLSTIVLIKGYVNK